MITVMKKYAFLVFHQDYRDFLHKLGKLGVLHVIERKNEEEENTTGEKQDLVDRINKALKFLDTINKEIEINPERQPEKDNPEDVLVWLEQKRSERDDLQKKIEELRKEISGISPWGNYEKKDFQNLTAAGFIPVLFKCAENQFSGEWEKEYDLFVINNHEGNIFFLVIHREGQELDINAEPVKPADVSLDELQKDLEIKEDQYRKLKESIAAMAVNGSKILEEQKKLLEDEISLLRVYHDTQKASGEKLRILEGWVPEDAEEKVLKFSEREDVISVATIPADGELPPVKLKNRRFSKLFEPISNLFDLPAYGELDLTPYFAPFFMLFFGFCLGDAGYGVFFILFAGLLKLKAGKEFKPILSLTQYLGVATIIFGLLSGTFFGINLIDSGYTLTEGSIEKLRTENISGDVVIQLENLENEHFKSREDFVAAIESEIGAESMNEYRKEILKSSVAGIPLVGKFRHMMQDSLSMFYLSILIGAMQILFGIFIKVLNVTRQKGFRYALSTVGWLILIISVVIYYAGLFEGKAMTFFFYGLLAVAGIMIFLLNNPDAGIFARIGGGVWESYNMATGIFGDLLSYIRLFALGISSAILGFVFNDISLQLLNVPYIGWLLFLVLLIIGHSINLFMATLGGFIHPMRLTFVEFYKNAGFTGGGKKYKPFIINN